MNRHPLLIAILMLLAVVAGQADRVAGFDLPQRTAGLSVASHSGEGSSLLAAVDPSDEAGWLSAADDPDEGLAPIIDAGFVGIAGDRHCKPLDRRVAAFFAPGYRATAPPLKV